MINCQLKAKYESLQAHLAASKSYLQQLEGKEIEDQAHNLIVAATELQKCSNYQLVKTSSGP